MLNDKQREALLWVRNCLDENHPEPMPVWMEFEMRSWFRRTDCGTACCIGGAMDIYLANQSSTSVPDMDLVRESPTYQELYDASEADTALHNLFCNYDSRNATPARAVKAIDAYLNGSSNPWEVE